MSDRKKFPAADAMRIAEFLKASLEPYCERIVIAGSLRRGKPAVGDIELLLIPKYENRPDGLFDTKPVDLADEALSRMLAGGKIKKRPNKTGVFTWGAQNKLGIHVETGIPVDFFSVLPERCPCGIIPNEQKPQTNVPRPDSINAPKPGSVQAELRRMRDVLPGQKREGVLQEMQCTASVERTEGEKKGAPLPVREVPSLRQDIHKQKNILSPEGMLAGMHKDTTNKGAIGSTEMDSSKGISQQGGICDGLRPECPTEGKEKRIDSGAPACDAKPPGQATGAERDGTSSERSETRQSTGKFGDSLSENTQGDSAMSALSQGVQNKVVCPICHGLGWHCPRWWVALVIRTGSKETNLRLTTGAQKRGGTIHAYGSGVTFKDGREITATSEKDVFDMCGVPYLPPEKR